MHLPRTHRPPGPPAPAPRTRPPGTGRARRAVAGLAAAALAATALTAPAAHAQTTGRDAGKDPRLMRLLRSMSLQDKAAQLFVLQVYGKSADTADPADVAANR